VLAINPIVFYSDCGIICNKASPYIRRRELEIVPDLDVACRIGSLNVKKPKFA
jgi:hypothetical protein